MAQGGGFASLPNAVNHAAAKELAIKTMDGLGNRKTGTNSFGNMPGSEAAALMKKIEALTEEMRVFKGKMLSFGGG